MLYSIGNKSRHNFIQPLKFLNFPFYQSLCQLCLSRGCSFLLRCVQWTCLSRWKWRRFWRCHRRICTLSKDSAQKTQEKRCEDEYNQRWPRLSQGGNHTCQPWMRGAFWGASAIRWSWEIVRIWVRFVRDLCEISDTCEMLKR